MMRFLVRIFILMSVSGVLVGCATWSAEDKENADLHLRMGTSMLENGNYPQALSELLLAQKYDPNNAIVQNNLGLVYYARDKMDLAEKHLRKALELRPTYTDARNNLGRILIDAQKYPEAEAALKMAADDLTFPNPEKPLVNLGLLNFRRGRYAEAKGYLLKSLEYQRANCLAQTLYGRSLLELKSYDSASVALDRAIGFCRNEQADEPQYYSALAYYQVGQQKKAEVRLEEITKIYPNGRYSERARSLLETMRK